MEGGSIRTYYERHLVCRKCKDSMRQTVYNLPLNRVGLKMEAMWERDFTLTHNCNAGVRYTDWRLVTNEDWGGGHNLRRARMAKH